MNYHEVTSVPFRRERNVILITLLILTVGAWVLLLRQAATMDAAMVMRPTMGMGGTLFLAIWVVMMVAMMFPSAVPMILMFARIHKYKQQRGASFVPTWVFTGGYMIVWTLMGVAAYALALGAEYLASRTAWIMENTGRIGGVIFILAGLYQLSPLKRRCLSRCHSPLAFVMGSWREGYSGALWMGLKHGFYCAGCCWLLMVILFPLGLMNVAAMATIAVLIFIEKSTAMGPMVAKVLATGLIVYGLLVSVI